MTDWINYLVGTIVIAVGLMIFYKALKEPVDAVFGLIGRGFRAITDKISGWGSEEYDEVIKYG